MTPPRPIAAVIARAQSLGIRWPCGEGSATIQIRTRDGSEIDVHDSAKKGW